MVTWEDLIMNEKSGSASTDSSVEEISVYDLSQNVFDLIGRKWMLVTAAKSETQVNTMTASWGGLGIMWGKPVAYVVIRPQRYTKEFIDAADGFSLSFYGEEYRKMLSYMGSVSGRDEDKINHERLTLCFDGEVPYFKEASLVLKVRKMYQQEMNAASLLEPSIQTRWYQENDWHVLYICEIEKVLKIQ